MSLQSRISDLLIAMGSDVKQLRTMITGLPDGHLDTLQTKNATSLVSAVNENFRPPAQRFVDCKSLPGYNFYDGTWQYTWNFGYSVYGYAAIPLYVDWFTDLGPGTWRFDWFVWGQSNSGIIDLAYMFGDDTQPIYMAQEYDTYDPGTANKIVTAQGIYVPKPTRVRFRAVMNGRTNPASSGYYMILVGIQCQRTS